MSTESESARDRPDGNAPETDPSSDPAVLQRRREAEGKLEQFQQDAREEAKKENGHD
ncbi:hypothetical protein [uncultured Arthrobacter sp.]|uniref:hypothetical protein n=1 Tax=uncultured Arthrobacter sp. TaxID=114050 RepID=UPI0026245A74|nr:hypothetical protein [uncultured Arthrobacter sp.]